MLTIELETIQSPIEYADGSVANYWVRVWQKNHVAFTGQSFEKLRDARFYIDGLRAGLMLGGAKVRVRGDK